nr:alpha-ketoglutarate-dependent dioxygenase AlkB homolog 6 [Tanacetum cinerariifolium]
MSTKPWWLIYELPSSLHRVLQPHFVVLKRLQRSPPENQSVYERPILSLGSPVVMDFTPHAKLVGTASNIEDTGSIEGTNDEKLPDHHPFSIALMPRSLLIFKDLAYSEYLH